jgi:DnaJ homolog subfamily B member 13
MLSLEECYHGCIKKMRFERRVMNEDGHTSNNREKILTIHVKRGWIPGTRIVFEKEGDQGPNNIPADIVFIVQDKQHPIFRRVGTDLIHTHKISLGLALVGTTIHIPTLDGRLLDIPITDIVRPGYTRVIPGEGMPSVDDQKKKGNLIIEFEIEFPKSLNSDQKEYVRLGLLAKTLPKKQKQQKSNEQEELEDDDE